MAFRLPGPSRSPSSHMAPNVAHAEQRQFDRPWSGCRSDPQSHQRMAIGRWAAGGDGPIGHRAVGERRNDEHHAQHHDQGVKRIEGFLGLGHAISRQTVGVVPNGDPFCNYSSGDTTGEQRSPSAKKPRGTTPSAASASHKEASQPSTSRSLRLPTLPSPTSDPTHRNETAEDCNVHMRVGGRPPESEPARGTPRRAC